MTKTNLKPGMLVITADGKARLVMPTKNDGLLLMAEDNKALKLSKFSEDLQSSSYRHDKDIMAIYDIMDNVNGHVFDTTNRELLFDAEGGVDTDYDDDCNDECDDDYGYDEEDSEDCACSETRSEFTKADVTAGMLAVTHDGKNRLAVPTADMGLVLAASDSKFIRMDKLNDDLTIADYRKEGKNVDKVYGLASGVTTDFYSTANRELLFDRDNQ